MRPDISFSQFNEYCRIQSAGATNMMDFDRVRAMSNQRLSERGIYEIVSRYDELKIHFDRLVLDQLKK